MAANASELRTTPRGGRARGMAAAAAALLAALWSTHAYAQFRLLGSDPPTDEFQTPGFNLADCQDGRMVELFYDGTTSGRNIHFWRGTVPCNSADARDGNPDTGTDCELLFQLATNGSEGTVERALSDFVECNNGNAELWAVVTDQADGSGDVPDTDVASLTFAVDTDVPQPPATIAATGAGENQIRVTWGQPDPSPGDLSRYRVYGEAGACDGSSSLVAGAAAPGTGSSLFLQDESGREADINPAALGLDLDETAVIAVSTVDIAGNESTLSGLSCITRVETRGFCEALRAEGGTCKDCSVRFVGAPQDPVENRWGWTVAALAGLYLWRLRRRAPPRPDGRTTRPRGNRGVLS